MEKKTPLRPLAEAAGGFELGHALGQSQAFAVIGVRCSASQAAGLQRNA